MKEAPTESRRGGREPRDKSPPDARGIYTLRSHSITRRIALGPHAGRKAFTLQTLPSRGEFALGLARANGFSHHAGVVGASDERDKLERLCRYITRPAVSTERLSLTAQGLIRYRLKTPTRDGNARGV